MSITDITADLRAEHDALDAVVGPLTAEQWATPTPSPRWSVVDQIGHLAYFDGAATTAIVDPERFRADNATLFERLSGGPDAVDEATLSWCRDLQPEELLARWRDGRQKLLDAAATLDDGARVAWYGPSMGARSFLTARLMETWAHGQDVVDAVGATRPPTDRLRHIAQLGVITHRWSFVNRRLEAPTESVRVDLEAPSGERWTWNDDAEGGTVRGPAEAFCLVVTQRRHLDDTALETDSPSARRWMELAQAFAGPATTRPPEVTSGPR